MTIKRGLKRIWILGSVLWVGIWLTMGTTDGIDFSMVFWGITGGLAIWWAIYWGISGFFSDEDKSGDEDKSDEDKKDY